MKIPATVSSNATIMLEQVFWAHTYKVITEYIQGILINAAGGSQGILSLNCFPK